MRKEVNTDLISGLIGLILTGVFYFFTEDISFLSIVFPSYLTYILGVISLSLLIKAWVKPARRPIFTDGNNVRVIVIGATLLVWWMAIRIIGFFTASVLVMMFIVCYLALVQRRLTVKAVFLWALIVVGEVSLFYLIFTRVLHVPLPKGFLL